MLQPQKENAVKGIEAGLQFSHRIALRLGPQLYNIGQGLVKGCGIKGFAGRTQQAQMQIGKLYNDVFIDLQMPFLRYSLGTHHIYKALVPIAQLLSLLVRYAAIKVYNLALDAVYIQSAGTYDVFYLPHIEQIFGNILFFPGTCGKHIVGTVIIVMRRPQYKHCCVQYGSRRRLFEVQR